MSDGFKFTSGKPGVSSNINRAKVVTEKGLAKPEKTRVESATTRKAPVKKEEPSAKPQQKKSS